MHKKINSILGILLIVILTIVTIAHFKINSGSVSQGKISTPIIIGSKDFTESKIVMQIWADALKKEGYPVEVRPNTASSVIYEAICSKQIDLYPEYTGTIAMEYLNAHILGKNAVQIVQIDQKGIQKKNLVMLNSAPGSDSQGIAIRTSIAKKYDIRTISDLQKKADQIRFVSQGQFNKREDGLPGLERVYGKFHFKNEKIYDPSLKYKVLLKDEGDVTPASTTEGQLATTQFITLKDNKHFWPAYNLVPLVRKETLNKYPRIKSILNTIDKELTTRELTLLNKKVDIDGESYQSVAQKWIEDNY